VSEVGIDQYSLVAPSPLAKLPYRTLYLGAMGDDQSGSPSETKCQGRLLIDKSRHPRPAKKARSSAESQVDAGNQNLSYTLPRPPILANRLHS
jgi:hypothetical protein